MTNIQAPMIPETRVMLDLETLGTQPYSVILSIGAVKFGDDEIHDTFYQRIDPESCVQSGLRMDVATVMWWLQQADAPRLEITKPGEPLWQVLMDFAAWIGDEDAEIWGNGSEFDNVLLANAYQMQERKVPWKFRNNRCYRTMKFLFPHAPAPARCGDHHNALDDARWQALHLMEILKLHPETAEA